MVLDDCSRAVPGYTVNLGAPSALNTPLALRQAIWTKSDPAWPMCGIPEMLYVDRGSDFISDHLAQVAADLKFAIVHSAVARPQGRGKVERLFGSINTELLTELPGHLRAGGASVGRRGGGCRRSRRRANNRSGCDERSWCGLGPAAAGSRDREVECSAGGRIAIQRGDPLPPTRPPAHVGAVAARHCR